MANGKITLEQFQKLDQATRDFHIWNKLQVLDNLHNRFASKWIESAMVWGMKITGSIILVAIIGLVIVKG